MLQTRSAVSHLSRQAVVVGAPDPNDLLNSAAVRQIAGGISDMTLWRWTRERGFPQPDATIARRKFWRRSTVQAWIEAQITGAN
jgi:predicted DNA-binding transcriptional regulator AlpA